jgi:DnaJ homologue, subfamily C, member 28, conserved domain
MAERKPPGLDWERWIDRQIREATERGEFDDLPGAGKPIPDLDKPFDKMWWVKGKLRSEGLTYLPPSLALRKEAHDALEAALQAKSEAEVAADHREHQQADPRGQQERRRGPPDHAQAFRR